MTTGIGADDPSRDWTIPGIFEVASGVYRIPLPLPDDALRAVNVYVIQDGNDTVLVDSGQVLDQSAALLTGALAALGVGLTDIDRFLITHYHRDHYTQAVALRRELGVRIGLGRAESFSLAYHRSEGAISGGLAPQIAALDACGVTELGERLRTPPEHGEGHGLGTLPTDIWEDPDDWLGGDESIIVGPRSLSVIETPGHTRGHVVFHDAGDRQLFAGDHVLPHITPSIGFEGAPVALPLGSYLASLIVVTELPDALLLPAHGPIAPSVHSRARELLRHHEQRLAEVHQLVAEGEPTSARVATRMKWTRRERQLSELDDVNAMLAILEVKAHLDYLVSVGGLSCADVGGIRVYQTASAG